MISIHAPHTGRDVYTQSFVITTAQISIHATHTGRDALSLYNKELA